MAAFRQSQGVVTKQRPTSDIALGMAIHRDGPGGLENAGAGHNDKSKVSTAKYGNTGVLDES